MLQQTQHNKMLPPRWMPQTLQWTKHGKM